MATHARKRPRNHRSTLDDDEQAELALKVRYNIGIEALVGEAEAERLRRLPLGPAATRWHRREEPERPVREPDDGTRSRAAALGVGAGRRGQWLRR